MFPELKPGGPDGKLSWYFTRRFTAYRRSVGVIRPRVSFHSFRKNVSTALDNAGVPQADVAALIGHERGFTFDTYSKGLELTRLQGIVKRIEYPGLDLSHLYVR
jgi:integrase